MLSSRPVVMDISLRIGIEHGAVSLQTLGVTVDGVAVGAAAPPPAAGGQRSGAAAAAQAAAAAPGARWRKVTIEDGSEEQSWVVETRHPDVQPGDQVEVAGRQGTETITLGERIGPGPGGTQRFHPRRQPRRRRQP